MPFDLKPSVNNMPIDVDKPYLPRCEQILRLKRVIKVVITCLIS